MLDADERWRAALEASGLGVWDWYLPTDEIFYSRLWKTMRGLDADEPGPSIAEWSDWMPAEDWEACGVALRAHIENNLPWYELDHRVRCKAGDYKWCQSRGMIVERDADGKPLRIIGTSLDIDEAKKASIRAQRHMRLHGAIPACNLAIARRKSIGELSHEVCRILVENGDMRTAWVGRPSADGARILPTVICGQDTALDLDSVVISTSPDEPTGRGPSGTAFRGGVAVWVEDSTTDPRTAPWRDLAVARRLHGTAAIPICQKNGTAAVLTLYTDEPAFFDETTRTLLQDMAAQFGLALDALEAEAAAARYQDRLRRSEQRTRAIFEKAPLGIALKDSITGRYLDVNPRFEEIVGRDRKTLLGTRWHDITFPDDRRELDLARILQTDNLPPAFLEKRYVRPDGSLAAVNVTIAHFETPEGGNPRHLAMVEDVTERIELQQQLSQRQRLEALGQLTGGIAHDFNNLLTVIIGNSEALAQALGEGDLGELAGLVLSTGERAADLTGRLLTFASRQSLAPRSVKVGDLVDGLLPLLRRAVPDGIELRLSARFSSRSVYADLTQLEMVLLNLVLNARDALPGCGRIEISSEDVVVGKLGLPQADLPPGRYIVLAVSDNGVGMSEETLEKAFDPFFTTKGPGQGSGLGLSMVYGFARQSGGHVEIASRLGKGTTVKLYLPATRKTPPGSPETEKAPDDRGAGETILIAEDDALVRKYVEAQVSGLGYRTIATPNGHAALAVLRGDTPVDLLFTDIAMEGGMDGIELADEARRIRPRLPVLFTSGHAEQHVERLARLHAPLLRKPYRRKDLAGHLRRALSASHA
ncbi:MAG: PAS domain S-box protein [Novosphingobium sp.]